MRWIIVVLAALLGLGCDRNSETVEYSEQEQPDSAQSNPRPPPEHLQVIDSFEIGGFTYGIDSVERSDVHAQFEDAETGEMEWVTIHYRMVNTSDEAMAPVVPDVIVETDGLRFRDTGGNAQIGEEAVQETGVSVGQLDELQPGETELNMAIFKIPDTHVEEFQATFDFDGYNVSTKKPLEYVFTLRPEPGTQVLAQPQPDTGVESDTDEAPDTGESTDVDE
jgi:hypothetical protein